jgi:HEAT repeat protein
MNGFFKVALVFTLINNSIFLLGNTEDRLYCSTYSEEECVKRIYSHLLIHDVSGAAKESIKAVNVFPNSKPIAIACLKALAESGDQMLFSAAWESLVTKFPLEKSNRHALEILAWGVIRKGEDSPQFNIRLNSLIAAAQTGDVNTIELIQSALKNPQVDIRLQAVKLVAGYGDKILKDQLTKMFYTETSWQVRLEIINAIGQLAMVNFKKDLKEFIASSSSIAEEKAVATIALMNMYESVELSEFDALISSSHSALKIFACRLAMHLDLKEYASKLNNLLLDNSAEVRLNAIYSIGILGLKIEKAAVLTLIEDTSYQVSIAAGWLASLQGWEEGLKCLQKWLRSSYVEGCRLSAAALITVGKPGLMLIEEYAVNHKDDYVRLNLALGLITHQTHIPIACSVIHNFLESNQHTRCMWNDNCLFNFIAPSYLSHLPHRSNYPYETDQFVRLQLLSSLYKMHDSRALKALNTFIRNTTWGISHKASRVLIDDGDEDVINDIEGLLNDDNLKVRVQTAFLLAILRNDFKAVRILERDYKNVERDIKIEILKELGRIGDLNSIPFLLEVLKEPFQLLRITAASSLIQCLYH